MFLMLMSQTSQWYSILVIFVLPTLMLEGTFQTKFPPSACIHWGWGLKPFLTTCYKPNARPKFLHYFQQSCWCVHSNQSWSSPVTPPQLQPCTLSLTPHTWTRTLREGRTAKPAHAPPDSAALVQMLPLCSWHNHATMGLSQRHFPCAKSLQVTELAWVSWWMSCQLIRPFYCF